MRFKRVLFVAPLAAGVVVFWALSREPRPLELPNRIPEPAPYDTEEAQYFPPPYEEAWASHASNPQTCGMCHKKILEQWNGSMMSNAWRDPAWRAAFFFLAKLTSTDGNCSVPEPPDGTTKAVINPFGHPEECSSTFNIGTASHTLSSPGSLLDAFCSRCHMPTNYTDNIPLSNVSEDEPSGQEHGSVDPHFNPTSDNGTGYAFATVDEQLRNTLTGKRGIYCVVCHSTAESRPTPFHNYQPADGEYVPALGDAPRKSLLEPDQQDLYAVADEASPNLGFAVGAGAYRLSPHALLHEERFGPLSTNDHTDQVDPYLSGVFASEVHYQKGDLAAHGGYYKVTFERAEFCGSCHDVTNILTLKNEKGRWVGGFPIERTYSEWGHSRYADRPGNDSFDPAFKRDCQTCHMQQVRGQPGTAQTLYDEDGPVPPRRAKVAASGPEREVAFSHNFVGGNTYVTHLVGRSINSLGEAAAYPELSAYSFSSADETSPYHYAVWEQIDKTGEPSQHARLAWDRLRNALELRLEGPRRAAAGSSVPLRLTVTNTGTGHKFPTGFPEGRNAWVALRAYDLATGSELEIHDAAWDRTSLGIGYLTDREVLDPNFPAECAWRLPAGAIDPYAPQFRAVASMDGHCPTLALPFATPLNLVVNEDGLPIDVDGKVIDRQNPFGLPQFQDLDGDGDVYDDAYLLDTRLRPLPHPEALLDLDRYAVVIPPGTEGPVAVTAAIYYQSFEAIVARKFLGNLADTDLDFELEPCVLKSACDGRTPTVEPAVVEGPAPVPMEVRSWTIEIRGRRDRQAPRLATYPAPAATDVYQDVVVKAFFSEPIADLDEAAFSLLDEAGNAVPGTVDQIGDGTWAFFPDAVFLELGKTYTARLAAGVCDLDGNCTDEPVTWSFQVAAQPGAGSGDTSVPLGYTLPPVGAPVPAEPPQREPRADRPAR